MAKHTIELEINPYKTTCNKCGGDVEVPSFHVDSDGDVEMEIEPCSACMDEAYEEGKAGA